MQPEELVAFLSDPANYESAPDAVTIVQTHASFVALTDRVVIKVKKPVNFGFLDFSTLDRRRHFCHEEVRLNRRMCRSIYEGVAAIARSADSRLFFAETEHPDAVEYGVIMRRLSSEGFMDGLVQRDALTPQDLERVCEKLSAFYNDHPATAATSAWGRIDRIRISVDENFSQIRQQEGDLLSLGAIRAFEVQADRFFGENEELLERRRKDGHIRDCHGDLHLDHVHISDEGVCIYDCIEFNERFRSIDVANDIAFLAMDLDFNGRPDLARAFTARMTELLQDEDLATLLPFYKTYRAIVRGKVAGLKALGHEVPDREREAARIESRRYYQLALQYAVTNDRPMTIAVMGRVGTGKSTQARMLGEALGWRVISSDETRKKLAGVPLHERGDDAARRRLYADDVSRKTYDAIVREAAQELSNGRGVVLDATFSRRNDRDDLRRSVRDWPLTFAEIVAPDDVIRERLSDRDKSSTVVSDARLSDFESLNQRYEAPDASDPTDGFRLARITSAATPAATQRLLLTRLVGLSNR